MSKCLGAAPVGSPCVPGQGPGTGLWRGSCRGSGEGGGQKKKHDFFFLYFFFRAPPQGSTDLAGRSKSILTIPDPAGPADRTDPADQPIDLGQSAT